MIRNTRRMVALAVAGAVAIAPVISGCGAGMDAQSAAPERLTEGVNVSVPLGDDEAPKIALRNMFVLGPKPEEPVSPGLSLPLYGAMINQVQGAQDRLVSVSSPQFESATIQGGGIALPPASRDGAGSLVSLHGDVTVTPGPESPGRPTQQEPTRPAQPTQSGQATQPAQPTGTANPEPTGPGSTANPESTPTSQNTAGPTVQAPPPSPGRGEQPAVVLNNLRDDKLVPGGPITLRLQFEKAGSVEFKVPLISRQGEYSTYPAITPSAQAPASPGAGNGQRSPQSPNTESPNTGAPNNQSPGNESPGAEPTQPGTSPSPNGDGNGEGGGAQPSGASAGH